MIVTFYSYKGGVGRSMAMANVAAWFAQKGLRVVIVDWDLEAPGLESFFFPDPEQRLAVRAKLGLLDLLLSYKDAFPSLPHPAEPDVEPSNEDSQSVVHDRLEAFVKVLNDALPPLSHMLASVKPSFASDEKGTIRLLTAGCRSEKRFNDYANGVQRFDWAEFYAAYQGEAYFEWMRRQLLGADVADVVLVDSRTGVAEMSGACTRQLADVVVVFCAPNDQNLEGVALMAESFTRPDVIAARRGRGIELVMVPARIDVGEGRPVDLFDARFAEKLDRFLPKAFDWVGTRFQNLRIPYVSAYAYSERLAVGDPEGVKAMQEAYETLAVHLALLSPEASAIRNRCAVELQQRFGLSAVTITSLDDELPSLNQQLAERLHEARVTKAVVRWRAPEELFRVAKIQHPSRLLVTAKRSRLHGNIVSEILRIARMKGVCVTFVVQESESTGYADGLPKGVRIYDIEHDWAAFVDEITSPCTAQAVAYLVPSVKRGFIERPAEARLLKEALLKSMDWSRGGQGSSVALVGQPGSGKTDLARHVCSDPEVMDFYEDGIVWVDLRDENLEGTLEFLFKDSRGSELSAFPSWSTGKRNLLVVDGIRTGKEIPARVDGRLLFITSDENLAREVGADIVRIGPPRIAKGLGEALAGPHPPMPQGASKPMTPLAMSTSPPEASPMSESPGPHSRLLAAAAPGRHSRLLFAAVAALTTLIAGVLVSDHFKSDDHARTTAGDGCSSGSGMQKCVDILELARRASDNFLFSDALARYTEVVGGTDDPQLKTQALLGRAAVHFKQAQRGSLKPEQYEKALSDLHLVADLAPSDSVYFIAAELENDAGNAGAARSFIEKGLALNPNNPWLVAKRAELSSSKGDYLAASEDYKRALSALKQSIPWIEFTGLGAWTTLAAEQAPKPAELESALGDALVKQGKADEALRAYDRAIALDGELWNARYSRAQLLTKRASTAEGMVRKWLTRRAAEDLTRVARSKDARAAAARRELETLGVSDIPVFVYYIDPSDELRVLNFAWRLDAKAELFALQPELAGSDSTRGDLGNAGKIYAFGKPPGGAPQTIARLASEVLNVQLGTVDLDASMPFIELHLGPLQPDANGAPGHATLVRRYEKAIVDGRLDEAAYILNGFRKAYLDMELRAASEAETAALHEAALVTPGLGAKSRVARLTGPGAPDETASSATLQSTPEKPSEVCSKPFPTPPLHEARCDRNRSYRGEPCASCRDKHRLCFRRVDFTLTPDPGYELVPDTGVTRTVCTGGSCAWNQADRASGYNVTSSSKTALRAFREFSSRPNQVQICSLQVEKGKN